MNAAARLCLAHLSQTMGAAPQWDESEDVTSLDYFAVLAFSALLTQHYRQLARATCRRPFGFGTN